MPNSVAGGDRRLAVRFCMLTAQRSGAVQLARWWEIDKAARVWTAPAAHMKAARPHRVPLTEAILAVLATVRPLATSPDGLIFPGARRGLPLSDMVLSMMVRGLCCDGLETGSLPPWRDEDGRAMTVHGLRDVPGGVSCARCRGAGGGGGAGMSTSIAGGRGTRVVMCWSCGVR